MRQLFVPFCPFFRLPGPGTGGFQRERIQCGASLNFPELPERQTTVETTGHRSFWVTGRRPCGRSPELQLFRRWRKPLVEAGREDWVHTTHAIQEQSSCPPGWVLPSPLKALFLQPRAQAARAMQQVTEQLPALPGHTTLQPRIPNGALGCAATFS